MAESGKRKRPSLTAWILLGLVAGILVGLFQNLLLPETWNQASIRYFHEPVGKPWSWAWTASWTWRARC
jgi:Na+/H+-dicarboxylate symporter